MRFLHVSFLFLVFPFAIYAQVGINTNSPLGSFHIDGKADNALSGNVSAEQALNDFIVTEEGNLGVGTINPAFKVDIQGNLGLSEVREVYPKLAKELQLLARDTDNGEVVGLVSEAGNMSVINFVTYKLTNSQGDWIRSFDTKISYQDYSVNVIGSYFYKTGGGNLALTLPSSLGGTMVSPSIYAFESNGTWSLAADYPGANTVGGENGTWEIYCLIVNKTISKNLPMQTYDLGGTSSGTATEIPSGL